MLYLYLAVSLHVISSVLVRGRQGQRPIYYISKILSAIEGNYPLTDKNVLELVFSTRKLWPYFQAHSIDVYTQLSLKTILQKP